MSRAEAIAVITAKLAILDDERVAELADIVQDLADPLSKVGGVSHLSGEERRLVAEGLSELNRGEYASDDAVEAVLRRPWA